MNGLRVSPLARFDLDQIYDRIARDKPDAARRWLDRTGDQFLLLAHNPEIGESRGDLRTGLRSISHGNYVIYFRSYKGRVEIIRVLHGARDILGLF
jgi:toxin ParE1/3/4